MRAVLQWKQIPFVEVAADADVYREVIVPRVGFPVIPVLITPSGETLQDTTGILDELESRFGEYTVYPSTPRQRLIALLLEIYGDEWLVIPAMHPPMHAAIERSYESLLCDLDAHFAQHDYLLGTRPSVGDFGLNGPLYAHQYRDPASGPLMRKLAPSLVRWVERMQHPPAPGSGDFLEADIIPDSAANSFQNDARAVARTSRQCAVAPRVAGTACN